MSGKGRRLDIEFDLDVTVAVIKSRSALSGAGNDGRLSRLQ